MNTQSSNYYLSLVKSRYPHYQNNKYIRTQIIKNRIENNEQQQQLARR